MDQILRYKVNGPHVVFEIIEGEAVIVNLRKGYYYSLQGAGVDIWDLTAQGFSRDEVVDSLSARYEANSGEIERFAAEKIEKFKEEQLIVLRKIDEYADNLEKVKDFSNSTKIKFVQPIFERFTDMQDVLLLDPIHDVDERGWPNRPADNTI